MIDLDKFPSGGLFIPAKESGSNWLLVAIHGSNGSSKDFEGLEDFINIPKLNYLYLNGPISSYSNYRWYSSSESRQDALSLLNSIFDYLEHAGYPSHHTFLMGFSQGAALTFEFGGRYKNTLAGYIAVSGRIEGLASLLNQINPQVLQKGKWLVTHGTNDFNLSVDVIRGQVEKLREAGFNIDYQEYDKKHEFESTLELPYIGRFVKALT